MTSDDSISFFQPTEDQPSLEREADLTVPEAAEQPTTRPPTRRPKQTKPAGSDPYQPFSW